MKFTRIDDLPFEQVSKSYSRRSLVGEKQMLSWIGMKAGSHGAAHHHPHEQAFWILSGEMTIRIKDVTKSCRAGEVILVGPDEEHEVWCSEDTELLTVLTPVRDDLLPGAPVPEHMKHDV
jgi:quercetin dioxygenase-like cupin family protein